MLLCAAATAKVSVITGSALAIAVHASWVDYTSPSTVTPGDVDTAISTATTTDVVPAPGASVTRNVKLLVVRNKDASASNVITVQHFDGTTTSELHKFTLKAGYSWVLGEDGKPLTYDQNGGVVQTPLQGRFLKRTVILTGTTTFTTSVETNFIVARMVAAGGQGGGAPAVSGENGSGGGSGSYAEWAVAVSPNTAYTCAVAAAASSAGTGANGTAGGTTTLTVGGTTVTCNGGSGGLAGTSISIPVLGGAGGTISTNGTLNIPGNAGEPSVCIAVAADNRSGKGADSPLGNGGAAKLNAAAAAGNPAGGFGAGGGGATTTGTATAGGASSAGVIIIDEYS